VARISVAGLRVDLEQFSHFRCSVQWLVFVSEILSVDLDCSEVMSCIPKLSQSCAVVGFERFRLEIEAKSLRRFFLGSYYEFATT
jgi:hypothetical protein